MDNEKTREFLAAAETLSDKYVTNLLSEFFTWLAADSTPEKSYARFVGEDLNTITASVSVLTVVSLAELSPVALPITNWLVMFGIFLGQRKRVQ